MSEKTKAFMDRAKEQTIGCEIEMAEITRSMAIKTVARYFGTLDTVSHDGGSYDAWSCRDTQGRVWKVMRDVSISASSDLKKAELVTPILRYTDLEDLQEIVRQLRHKGGISNPEHSAGVHIHIGAQGQTPQSLRTLANLMSAHEKLLAEAINIDSYRQHRYCRTVNPEFLKELNKRKPTTMSELADIWYTSHGASYGRSQHYNSSRYAMLNYHAVFTHGTILPEQNLYPKNAGKCKPKPVFDFASVRIKKLPDAELTCKNSFFISIFIQCLFRFINGRSSAAFHCSTQLFG